MSFRFCAFLLLTLTLLWAGPVAAASPAPAPAATNAAALPDKAQIDQAIKLLEDDQARDRLIKQLKALNKAVDAVDGEEERVTVGARVLAEIRARYAAAQKLWETAASVTASWPTIVAWIDRQAANKASHERWVNFFIALAEVLIAGYAARAAVWWALGRPRRWLENRTPPTALAKLPYLAGRTLLNALPAVALAVAGYGVLALTDPAEKVRVAALPIINAGVAIQLTLLAGAFFLSPTAPGLRLLNISDAAAVRATGHLKHMAAVGFYGWFLTESAFVLGLPKAAYELILKIVGGAVTLMILHRLFTWRRAVARLIRGDHDPATGEATGRLGAARRRLAEVWHLIAVVYVVIACAVWLLEIKGGFTFIAKATVVSAAALFFAQALAGSVNRALAKSARLSPTLTALAPSLERRLDGYRPWAARIVIALIWLTGLIVAADAWGTGALDRLASPAGQRVVGSVLTIGLALALSVAAWETVSLSIERALLPEGKDGARVERSARVRTLLPLLRNAFLVLLVIFVGLFTLAELGVNIGPLLAGAGVIGLAVGFGSQTLVKDVITGLFILIEDTIAVGDVVDVGGKHIGAVEAISIRTIRLRDVSGAVHTVPFSAVTTIRNMTKDYSFAVFDVQVGYNEDPDRVAEVLKEIAHSIMEDEAFRRDLLAPLEVMGLDRLADSGIVIKARFKTRPMRQWAIFREFNRRMKKRFDELGISIPYPHMQLLVNPQTAAPGGSAGPQPL
jgi:moderate conductance mechanosensitive channel